MSVVRNHIPEVIPNHKCYMNMSLILSGYEIMMDIQHIVFFFSLSLDGAYSYFCDSMDADKFLFISLS
jgi:hypothetical protein